MKRIVTALVALSLLSGCGILGRRSRPNTPTVGTRIAVLGTEGQVEADPLLAAIPVTVPAPVANTDWAQPGGNASKSMGHVALAAAPTQAWSVSIGNGNSFRTRLVAEPVVADGRVYTIDTLARVRAFDIRTGNELWMHQVRGENSPPEALFGGGVTYDGGRIYATNGVGDAAALDAATGNQVWMVKPGGPLRGAPTVGQRHRLRAVAGQPALCAERPEWRAPLAGRRLVRARRRVRQRRARLRAIDAGRRLFLGRAHRLSL